MSNDLVSYSRAGDVFHYRWAARRCLQLIRPNTSLQKITIEGSDEKEKAGEYVIDVAEYSLAGDGRNIIDYYQLKHTTVQQDIPFELSNLRVLLLDLHKDSFNIKIIIFLTLLLYDSLLLRIGRLVKH